MKISLVLSDNSAFNCILNVIIQFQMFQKTKRFKIYIKLILKEFIKLSKKIIENDLDGL